MVERFRSVIVANPWRTAVVFLTIALLVSLVFNLTRGGDDAEPDEDHVAAPTSTSTSIAEGGTTTSTSVQASTTTTVSATSPGGFTSGGVIGVKVDNAPGAQPQVGIGQAPLLIEFPVEGGITRFTAVFPRETSGLAGPLRSLRPVDADLLPALSPVIVSTGGRPFVLQDVDAAGMNSILAGFSSMFVSLGRPDPHDTFVDLELVSSIVDDSLIPAGGGLPAGALPASAASATEVELPFGVSFDLEDGSGYVRSQDGRAFEVLDLQGETSSPLAHDTLVVMFAAERSAGYTDSNGVPVSTYDVIGAGDLLVFSGGEVFEGSWSRSALVDGFAFTDESGQGFGLPEGRTYLAVVARGSEVGFG